MEDLSDILKRHYCGLYKKKPENFGTVTERVVKLNEQRKVTRHEEMFGKRKIPLNMSPVVTPDIKRDVMLVQKQQPEPQPPRANKRLEMLAKWKAEKEKRKVAEKKNSKPVFKVSRVVATVGLPNLEKVNTEIKGKSFKSKFAPVNHQFKPPANIKPIHFNRSVIVPAQDKKMTDTSLIKHRMTTRSKARGCEPLVELKPAALKKSSQKEKMVVKKDGLVEKNEAHNRSMSPDFPGQNVTTSESDDVITPKKTESPVYVSPFVTISRGRDSARKEYEARKSGKSLPLKEDFADSSSSKAGAAYFTRVLDDQISRLEGLIGKWTKYKEEENLPEEAQSMIDVTIGQTNLLLTKKFMQFRGLIDRCKEEAKTDTPVTCEDLHGFWDMIYLQVENIDKRYENLDNLKTNNWEEILPEVKKVVRKTNKPKKNAKASAGLREAIEAARRKKLTQNGEAQKDVPVVKTPIKRRSTRVSVVKTDEKNHRKSSPGLMMMKVAQYAKGVGTPAKSILKTDGCKSAKSLSKSVLFEDEIEELENDLNKINVQVKARTPTRKSKRLSKTKLF